MATKTMKNQIMLHCSSTNAYESELSTNKSPLKQICALHLITSPAGLCLYQNTHVHGTICLLPALDLRHLTHTPFPSSCLISLRAANQAFQLSSSRIALLYDKMSGFFFFEQL